MAKNPLASVVVNGGGSSRGIKALLDGTADIAVTSGPLSKPMQQAFERSGKKLQHITLGFRPLAVAVHPSLAVQDISPAELAAIFSGRISTWPARGKVAPAPIQVLVGPPGGGVTQAFKELVFDEDDNFTAQAQVIAQQPARMQLLSTLPRGISYLALGGAPVKVKYLSINGVQPTAESVASGAYLLRTPLVLVSLASPPAAVQSFLASLAQPAPSWRLDGLVLAAGPAKKASP